mgnify:CR=1 FL=1
MKILALSDLHIHDDKSFHHRKKKVQNLMEEYSPDTVVITGDIF